jgi:predicted patatin/cPLA2 family phospholipase
MPSVVPSSTPKRALILAGGGIKVAFQAGVLQVWLDEAGLNFDLADGASGGCLNLAMWSQGMSGLQMADNWRNIDPVASIDVNWTQYLRLFHAASLFELEKYRKVVFPAWGLDWARIHASSRDATFNVYNFSRHELAVVPPAMLTEDLLAASISLPMWFPPVRINGEVFIDAVFNTDANLEEAIRRGADELWVIWTVSQRGEWHDGFVANYFQIIEASANGRYKQLLARIEASNARIAGGSVGEFGRPIRVRELKAEVPLHYLVNFSQDRVIEAVNRGVAAGRAWCAQHDIPLRHGGRDYPLAAPPVATTMEFTEEMQGFVSMGATDPHDGSRLGRERKSLCSVHLVVKIDDIDRFVVQPEHEARLEGTVTFEPLGTALAVRDGVFNLFVDADGDPSEKRMKYRIPFIDAEGQPYTLLGEKVIHDDPGFDAWEDTTTLFTQIVRGTVDPAISAPLDVVAAGILRLRLRDLMAQLATFRSSGASTKDQATAFARFGRLFVGHLWDVYAREVLSSGPV